MEYYTAEKHNDILNFAGKWIVLENIIWKEATQTQKDKYNMFIDLIYMVSRKRQGLLSKFGAWGSWERTEGERQGGEQRKM